jgi:hypothetical protein
MFISEDGTVTGSIDRSKLDEVEAKTDEAKAQIEALKAEAQAGQEQAARDAERLAEQSRRQHEQLHAGDQQSQADQGQDAEVAQLQADAEKAGVTVDKRWGADRLRQEIASAQQAKRKG